MAAKKEDEASAEVTGHTITPVEGMSAAEIKAVGERLGMEGSAKELAEKLKHAQV